MKRFVLLLLTLIMVFSFTSLAMADGFAKCQGCHNGTLAPTKEQLKEKFTTPDDLIKAAMENKNAMMKAMQDKSTLKAAADSLYK